jgi:hypothetical protein
LLDIVFLVANSFIFFPISTLYHPLSPGPRFLLRSLLLGTGTPTYVFSFFYYFYDPLSFNLG